MLISFLRCSVTAKAFSLLRFEDRMAKEQLFEGKEANLQREGATIPSPLYFCNIEFRPKERRSDNPNLALTEHHSFSVLKYQKYFSTLRHNTYTTNYNPGELPRVWMEVINVQTLYKLVSGCNLECHVDKLQSC